MRRKLKYTKPGRALLMIYHLVAGICVILAPLMFWMSDGDYHVEVNIIHPVEYLAAEPEPFTASTIETEVTNVYLPIIEVADIIWAKSTQATQLDYGTCVLIANEIVYWVDYYEFNMDQDIPYILALYWQESRFDPEARNSHSTASGIGQLLQMHWEDGCDPLDLEWNLKRSFELIFANYRYDLPPNSCWRHYVYPRYCGNSQNSYNVIRHYPEFLELWENRCDVSH